MPTCTITRNHTSTHLHNHTLCTRAHICTHGQVLRKSHNKRITHSAGPDFEALVTGTVTEENVDVALELSQRWVLRCHAFCSAVELQCLLSWRRHKFSRSELQVGACVPKHCAVVCYHPYLPAPMSTNALRAQHTACLHAQHVHLSAQHAQFMHQNAHPKGMQTQTHNMCMHA